MQKNINFIIKFVCNHKRFMMVDINGLIFPISRSKTSVYNPSSSEIIFLHKGRSDIASNVEKHFLSLNESTSNVEGHRFVYLPYELQEILDNNKHLYYFPDLDVRGLHPNLDEVAIWDLLNIPEGCKNALLLGCTKSGDMFGCTLDTVLSSNLPLVPEEFSCFLRDYENTVDEHLCAPMSFYEIGLTDDIADTEFEAEVNRLSEEIVCNINRLRAIGISEVIIRQLFNREQKLSRLVITEDYKIILPDYNNMEIKMEPLPKAIYLLFLMYPEGIRFKELPDYKNELAQIYLNVTNRNDLYAAYQSIANVIDPTKNSINEKCSRIKEAFVSRFDDNLASHYYITGLAGEKKGIKLARKNVELNIKSK